ncbi:MAG: hypothetical protein AAB618_03320 [Patescibacteria group bacterium]
MKKFLVLYMAPAASLEEWMKLDESVRKADEEKMMAEWNTWMAKNSSKLPGPTSGAGKTKRVTKGEVADVKNDVMLVSIIEAESQEIVADAYKDHPHFGIPGGWIDVMPMNDLSGM